MSQILAMDKVAIEKEIEELNQNIRKLHTEAWTHRVKNDDISFRCAQRLIRARKARIKLCEWALTYIDSLQTKSD